MTVGNLSVLCVKCVSDSYRHWLDRHPHHGDLYSVSTEDGLLFNISSLTVRCLIQYFDHQIDSETHTRLKQELSLEVKACRNLPARVELAHASNGDLICIPEHELPRLIRLIIHEQEVSVSV